MSAGLPITVDIELTNRCNADCSFCPRDATPHQGMMAPETFTRALARAVEYRQTATRVFPETAFGVTFCGMGEPLLHADLPECVARVADAGIAPSLSTNGSLLDEEKARALIDGGLRAVFLNIGEHDEAYEATYKLPFQRAVDNVVRFRTMAGRRCEVVVALVDHRDDPAHLHEMRAFWAALGIDHTFTYPLNNRGGSLDVERLRHHADSEVRRAWEELNGIAGTPMCGVPFHRLFVGYDGAYYLCSSDWEKRAPMSNVFDSSFLELTDRKLAHVASREPVCRTCSLDPTNTVAAARRGEAAGMVGADADLAHQARRIAVGQEIVHQLGFEVPVGTPPHAARRRIPLRSA